MILLADQSPLLKVQYEHIIDWLIEHDYVFKALEISIAIIPFWMVAVIVYEKHIASKQQ